MAYHQEKTNTGIDTVFDGFEKGIADSPELGLGDMRGVNITSIPGEASVSFSTAAIAKPPSGQTSIAYTVNSTNDTLTVPATVGYYNGMAVTLDTVSTTPQVNALLVGGGGGGGFGIGGAGGGGGGGGGGGFTTISSLTVAVGSYPVLVGAGGGTGSTTGADGNVSSFGGTTANGGGGGGGLAIAGDSGGSGGGGGGLNNTNGTILGGAGSQGFAGGSAFQNGSTTGAGGGGGGAGAVGTGGGNSAGLAVGGNGGVGATSSISGASVTYAGGGAGGAGSAGGGNPGTPGTAGTGSIGKGGNGGGGINTGAGTSGTSGTVVISYLTGVLTATGGTITTSGSNTIHTFTAAGTSAFVVTAINPLPGTVLYIGNLSSTTFKLYHDADLTNPVDFISNITGVYSVPVFGTPIWSSYNPLTFILDTSGNCWYLNLSGLSGIATNALQYAGNTGHSPTNGLNEGIAQWNGYLFLFLGTHIDYLHVLNFISGAGPTWVYSWQPNGSLPLTNTIYQHYAIPATDDAIYICNGNTVASLLENAGTTFDPTNNTTYTFNPAGLTLPQFDEAQSLGQLGTTLLVGGILNYVYPWDRVSTSFNFPLICADSNIVRIVSTNTNAYVFAGSRGRIYITNGSQIQVYKKIPDALSGNPEPYYIWQDALYLRNKIYFTMTATDNSGTTLNTMGGIWSLGIDAGQTAIALPTAGSLFNTNQLSYGTYGGSCPVLFYNQNNTPPGYGVCASWVNSSVSGIDLSSSVPYTNFQTYIETDIVPVGTFYEVFTGKQLEYKLSRPLVTGESVRVSYRATLADAYTPFLTSVSLAVSDAVQLPFQKIQWVQFKIELSSTDSSPSYVRLTQLRIR